MIRFSHGMTIIGLAVLMNFAIWWASRLNPNTKTYTHVAVVTDGMKWPGTGIEWRIHNDTLWVFLK